MSDRKCPNCGAVGVPGADDSFACPGCGGTFVFKAGETKLDKLGELDEFRAKVGQHDADIEELKKRLPASKPNVQPPEDPSDEPDPPFDDDDADDEEDL